MRAFNRRTFMAGCGVVATVGLFTRQVLSATSDGYLTGADFGLVPQTDPNAALKDQSAALQAAVDGAARAGRPLMLAGGAYLAGPIDLPSGVTIVGVRGATRLLSAGAAPVLQATQKSAITLRDLTVDGRGSGVDAEVPGLLYFAGCDGLELDAVRLAGGDGNGVHLDRCAGRLENLVVHGFAEAGIFAVDNAGLAITGARIFDCGNGGIRVWARESGGHDGTMVADNDIYDIRSDGGGNGQNGNGINVFRASAVTVSGNRMRNCAFSGIRLNGSTDAIVSGNTCLNSGEVAIFSEFDFSGSVIANNIVDGAAQGISITNFDSGGRLATCSGNIVRNIYPDSKVNPDTVPAGIFAEADATITGNVVEMVPGIGIGAGWGPFLRDVGVSGNVVRDTEIGIAVSVAEGAGAAVVSGNRVSGARRAGIAGMAWQDLVTADLQNDAGRFAQLAVSGNTIG